MKSVRMFIFCKDLQKDIFKAMYEKLPSRDSALECPER